MEKSSSIGPREAQLADQLRSVCTRFGEERKKKLGKSADILLELGKEYFEKSKQGSGIEQKLNYIRCSVLLHAAIARYEILGKQSQKIHKAKDLCFDLSRELLLLSTGGSKSTRNLFVISTKIYKDVITSRNEMKEFIKTHLYRPKKTLGNSPPEWLQKLRENHYHLPKVEIESILTHGKSKEDSRITTNVMKLNRIMSDHFKNIMCQIAEECLQLMGAAPCRFSIVGLGSLAREEVTLYSDFEHVILVEEGVELREDHKKVFEYFQWFSVVFQTIVIGFGETIIPSVQIESLNDSYSEERKKDWFFDRYSPRGISFDGMLPHSCNVPLGRQRATKNRPHVVELIKTPKDMAKYLTHKQCIKNGYFLDEVLRRTCLVFGDTETYDCFLEERKNVLEAQHTDSGKEYTEKILRNANRFVRDGKFSLSGIAEFNVKDALYRPLVTSLDFLAKLHGVEFTTTFHAIGRLFQKKAITTYLYYCLSYAFAVICELRVKVNAIQNQQRHETRVNGIKDIVGEDSAFLCKDMITYLATSFEQHIKSVENGNMWVLTIQNHARFAPTIERLMAVLDDRGYFHDSERFLRHLGKHFIGWEHEFMLLRHYNGLSQLVGAVGAYKRLLKYKDLPRYVIMEAHLLIGHLCLYSKQFSEGMEAYEEFFKLNCSGEEAHHQLPAACYNYNELAFFRQGSENAELHLENMPWNQPLNVECNVINRIFTVRIEIRRILGSSETMDVELKSIVHDICEENWKFQMPRKLLQEVATAQISLQFFSDAVETVNTINEVRKPHDSRHELEIVEWHCLDVAKFLCLCRLDRRRVENDRTLRELVFMLWKKLHTPGIASKKELGVILYWVTNLKVTDQQDTLFKNIDKIDACPELRATWGGRLQKVVFKLQKKFHIQKIALKKDLIRILLQILPNFKILIVANRHDTMSRKQEVIFEKLAVYTEVLLSVFALPYRSEIRRMSKSLFNVAHILVTGMTTERKIRSFETLLCLL